ncbi:MAG TPA: HesA/MoeB/ThiF family protein [Rhodanobacteraceae bacterium]
MNRYARQMILPEVGAAGQARLARAHVLVVGAGGLGVPVLQYLAGAGVGRITLVDGDTVEEGNLHRQPLYAGAVGQAKALAAAQLLRRLNPEVRVDGRVAWLDPANAVDWIAAADVVLDCADTYAVSYTLSDVCRAAGKPLILASALGLTGYVGGFCAGAPSLRAVFPAPGRGGNCASAGVLGPVVGTLGMLQAQMALGVLLGWSPTPLGLLLRVDLARWHVADFRFDEAPEPTGQQPYFIARQAIREDDFVVELRGHEEAPVAVMPAAHRLSAAQVGTAGSPLPRAGQRAVLACATGLRAWRAAEALARAWQGEIALVAVPREASQAS